MTIQQFVAAGAAWWLIVTLARCAIDEYRLWRLARQIKKGGFL